jgi:hypothetical protein
VEASGKTRLFFGAHDVNRVQFTEGPRSEIFARAGRSAAELFCYPDVEIGEKEYAIVSLAFSFEAAGEKVASALH